jgi:hypothetical protein
MISSSGQVQRIGHERGRHEVRPARRHRVLRLASDEIDLGMCTVSPGPTRVVVGGLRKNGIDSHFFKAGLLGLATLIVQPPAYVR